MVPADHLQRAQVANGALKLRLRFLRYLITTAQNRGSSRRLDCFGRPHGFRGPEQAGRIDADRIDPEIGQEPRHHRGVRQLFGSSLSSGSRKRRIFASFSRLSRYCGKDMFAITAPRWRSRLCTATPTCAICCRAIAASYLGRAFGTMLGVLMTKQKNHEWRIEYFSEASPTASVR
jgi:hypothetical protein